MYSKEKGFTSPPTEAYMRRPGRTPRVSVPPNYRGHAIVDGEERPLGLWEDTRPHPTLDTPVPRFDDLPRVSSLSDGHRHHAPAYLTARGDDPIRGEEENPPEDGNGDGGAITDGGPPDHVPHLLSPGDHPSASHPHRFGGTLSLGLEELILLGLILFLMREGEECSDRGDLDETVILLGLLLLLG